MDRYRYYVASPGVLAVATNAPNFKWSFATTAPPVTLDEFDDCAVRLRLDVVDDVSIPRADQVGKYHYWLGNPDEDVLYYDRSFVLGKRLRMAVHGVCSGSPTLTVNRNYYRYISHRFMNLHSVGYILTDLAALLLLRSGFAPLHCSAFKSGDATVVVAAPPNTGKTLTTMLACMEHSADFIAEDLAITDGRTVYSVPWTSTFRYYNQVEQGFATRLRHRATKLLPLVELIAPSNPPPITRYVPTDRLTARARATHLLILERGPAGIDDVGTDEAFPRVHNLNRYEFNYFRSPLAVAYEYFNPQLDLVGALRTEESILRQLLENCDYRWIVRSHDASRYANLTLNAIRRATVAATPACAVA